MGPIQALRSCLSKSFRWRGRAARSEFWWFFLIYNGGFIAYVIFFAATGDEVGENDIGPLFMYLVLLFPAFLAAMARRLHDKGLTAWLLLLLFVPFGQLALLILAVLRGDEGPNGYGDDPLAHLKSEPLTYGSSRVPLVRDKD